MSEETYLRLREFLDNGVARRICKDELSKLLDLAEKSGLVINTSNTQDLSIVFLEKPDADAPFPDHQELMLRVSRERGLI
jgi:hypothetical protein